MQLGSTKPEMRLAPSLTERLLKNAKVPIDAVNSTVKSPPSVPNGLNRGDRYLTPRGKLVQIIDVTPEFVLAMYDQEYVENHRQEGHLITFNPLFIERWCKKWC